jgi:hypothetical protein
MVSTTPVETLLLVGRTATDLAVGGDHACAILDDQSFACWGDGDDGALGTGSSADAARPVIVPGFAGATQISVGRAGTCARFDGGKVACAGELQYLANGDTSGSTPALTLRSACAD